MIELSEHPQDSRCFAYLVLSQDKVITIHNHKLCKAAMGLQFNDIHSNNCGTNYLIRVTRFAWMGMAQWWNVMTTPFLGVGVSSYEAHVSC